MGGPGYDETLTADGHAPATTGAPFAVGTQVGGRYEIVRFIAAGGMGEVYEAEDKVLGTRVALKAVRAAHADSAAAVDRLKREISLARKVTHANICRVHDVGEHAGRAFLTMELLDGETLADRLKRGRLEDEEVERIAPQLVAALGALHAAGVVHRDFKSSNIILDGERVVVTDFGLARSSETDGDARLTADAALLGTPAYMAPEQVEGREATAASDVYALGVVLYEMTTGALPFAEDTPLATATARLTKAPPVPETSARWQGVILRCLERAPEDRPRRVEDVLGARRRRRGWIVVAAAALVVAAGIAVVFAMSRGSDRDEVTVGSFRADLSARLLGASLLLPPLRDRTEDLSLLVATLLERAGADATFTVDAARALYAYAWPLNVRELEHALATACALAAGGRIEARHLPAALQTPAQEPVDDPDDAIRASLVAALERHGGNLAAVGRELGKDRTQIRRWMKRFGLER